MNSQINTRLTVYLCLGIALVLNACADTGSFEEIQAPTTEKVINGEAEFSEPSTLAIGYGQNGSIGCTGTLIGAKTVLTAAHCLYTLSDGYNIPNVVGVVLNGQVTETSQVVDYAIHPLWDGRTSLQDLQRGVDLSILYLGSPLSVTPTMLDQRSPYDRVGQVGKIVGYGKTNGRDNSSGGTKNSVNLKVAQVSGSNQSLLALTSADYEYRGACHGDSGGPFFIGEGAQKVLSGVTSFGESTCDGLSYYVSTAYHGTWINENLLQRTTGVREVGADRADDPNAGGANPGNPGSTPGNPSPASSGSCFDLVACLNRCDSSYCQDSCLDQASSTAVSALSSVYSCNTLQGCNGDSNCLQDRCYNEIYSCDPRLVSGTSSRDPSQQPGQQPGQQPSQSSQSCGDMVYCMDACASDACVSDCYYNASVLAQVEYDMIIQCANTMGCQTSECVETYCYPQINACFD